MSCNDYKTVFKIILILPFEELLVTAYYKKLVELILTISPLT